MQLLPCWPNDCVGNLHPIRDHLQPTALILHEYFRVLGGKKLLLDIGSAALVQQRCVCMYTSFFFRYQTIEMIGVIHKIFHST
jgi:hypothetical protein